MQSPATSRLSRLPLPFTPIAHSQAGDKRPLTPRSKIGVPKPSFTKDFSITPPRRLDDKADGCKSPMMLNDGPSRGKSSASKSNQDVPPRRLCHHSMLIDTSAQSEFEELRNCFVELSTTVARQDIQIQHLLGEIAHLRTELHIQRATDSYIKDELTRIQHTDQNEA